MKQSTATKFDVCPECVFFFKEPAMCQICKKADQFESASGGDDTNGDYDDDTHVIDFPRFDRSDS